MAQAFAPLKNDLLLRAARAGRYLPEYHEAKGDRDFFEICRSPEIASTLTLQPVERYEGLIDAAIIFSDILVIPQAMGMTVEMIDKKGPSFPDPLTSPADEQYTRVLENEVDVSAELGYVYEAITLARQKLNGRVPLLGFCGAPWTLLCYMVEGGGTKLFIRSKTWIYKYPIECKRLLQKLAEICVEHLFHQICAGAQMVQVFDSWAGELSPSTFREFALPYLRYISAHLPRRLRGAGRDVVPITVFAKGAWYALDELCDSGYDVVGLDWLHDPAEAMSVANGRVVIQGNADPGCLYGSREGISKVVECMVRGFWGEKKGWICNLGHGITPLVNPDDLKFFFEEDHRCTGTAQVSAPDQFTAPPPYFEFNPVPHSPDRMNKPDVFTASFAPENFIQLTITSGKHGLSLACNNWQKPYDSSIGGPGGWAGYGGMGGDWGQSTRLAKPTDTVTVYVPITAKGHVISISTMVEARATSSQLSKKSGSSGSYEMITAKLWA
ncbi:Uroporphyrinogen decarboxylase in heme biosynthesis [Ascosphaera aggregata]|nr:Uroporphyrinogen decarboxylase in heme biosynthesis [Ascosphaera aggregata]